MVARSGFHESLGVMNGLGEQMASVYAYVRFSSDRQRDGDSIKRQTEAINAYCLANSLTVTEWMRDEGKSAFHGVNRKRGDFARFLGRVVAGEIEPGSILIVESVDRLSREEVMTALDTYTTLINAGLTIVTTMDGQSFSRANYNSQWTNLILTLSKMAVANEESAKKSVRSKGAWHTRRQLGTKLGSCQPGWLDRALNPIPERVAVVNRIFREVADNGCGTAKVAARLNHDGVPIFTKGRKGSKGSWHNGVVRSIIRGRAVLGEFQPMMWDDHRRSVPAGPVIPDYYPAVVDSALYHRAQAVLDSRGFKGGQGRKGDTYANLFSKLIVCGACGSNLRSRTGGKYRYLVCSSAARRACSNTRAVRYEEFEETFLDAILEVRFTAGKADDSEAVAALAEAEHRRATLQTKIENFVAMIAKGTISAALGQALDKAEVEAADLDGRIEAARKALERVRSTPAPNAHQNALMRLREAVSAPGADVYAIRSRMALAIKQVVTAMCMDGEGGVHVELDGAASYQIKPGRKFWREARGTVTEGGAALSEREAEAFKESLQEAA